MTTSLPDIGLVGIAGSGKDTAAQALYPLGYGRVAFADLVREAVLAMDPWVAPYNRLSELVTEVGWEAAKRDHPEVRRLLVAHGMAVRSVLDPDAWMRAGERRAMDFAAQGRPCVFTDVRFQNEADMIRDRGGILISVLRPDTGPPSNEADISAAAIRCSYYVMNDGPVAKLHGLVLSILNRYTTEDLTPCP